MANLSFSINPIACLKDPTESALGRRLLQESINLIDEIGLEHFTFKKLANKTGSTEASVYRYFENKHRLLVYLSNWYWSWLQNKIMVKTYLETSTELKLETIITLLASPILQDEDFNFIDEKKLYNIIIAEGAKAYLIKDVDMQNNEGTYLAYKKLCQMISDVISTINPRYEHPHTLASTIVETCHNQIFFSEHLPKLTDVSENDYESLKKFILHLTITAIK